jgi:hypothetical protein
MIQIAMPGLRMAGFTRRQSRAPHEVRPPARGNLIAACHSCHPRREPACGMPVKNCPLTPSDRQHFFAPTPGKGTGGKRWTAFTGRERARTSAKPVHQTPALAYEL